MPSTIDNCRKCNKLFPKVVSELCVECINLEEEQFKVLYRALQRSAAADGIAAEDLSDELGIPVEDIERFYLEGRLSMAGTRLKFQCQACSVVIGELQRRGRYCVACSEKTATQAKVEVKSLQELEKNEQEARRKQEQQELLRRGKSEGSRRFGMARHRL